MAELIDVFSKEKELDREEIKARKEVIDSILDSFVSNSLEKFYSQALRIFNRQYAKSKKISKELYSLDFESLDVTSQNNKIKPRTIYIAFAVDSDMQKELLGSWTKDSSENIFKFWIRVCHELKKRGLKRIELKNFDKYFWLNEAYSKVFND